MRFSSLPALALATAAIAGALAAATPAQADDTPTYTCDKVLYGSVVLGEGNCTASNGATEQGAFLGEFLVTSREEPQWTFRCHIGGVVQLPEAVRGDSCEPVV
ncbi:hypothetical protein GCM10027187_40250 [Streptosporangium sandarakinum]|uniref:Uncharacterized protein n=1 Tax=Streptosporangium sandarakinum TaxID=1260955 RepID=A0A852VC63_9ACTN|nr:hypothetical protein [Streptosporangium sandarakinum]NYF44644.1 hypothetical protein [Streptosporangium sandarakinum]